MFPLPWNFPFRKKDGTVVNVEDAMSGGGGGGSGLPDYDSSDAGKVLSVNDNGELAWSEELKDALEDVSDLQEDVQSLDTHVSRIDSDLSLYGGSIISNWEGSGVNVISSTMKDNTLQGITFTVNEDKTIRAVGTSLTAFGPQIGTAKLKAGVTYKIFDTINEDVGNANAFIVAMDSNNTILMGSIATEQYPNEYTPMQDISVKVSFIILPNVTLDKLFFPSIVDTSIDPGGYVIPAKSNAQLTAENQALEKLIGKTTIKTLASGATSIEFDVPTSGDNLIEIFTEGGTNYSSIDTSVSGKVTLTYDAVASDRTISCRIASA